MQSNLPSVITNMEINKKDIVDVAVAKIEAQLRAGLKAAKTAVEKAQRDLIKAQKDLDTETAQVCPKHLVKIIDTINEAIRPLSNNDKTMTKAVFETEIVPYRTHDGEGLPKENQTTVSFCRTTLHRENTPATPQQIALARLIEELENDLEEKKQEAIEWRAKLSDMPLFERQMKARVVENELVKSEEGRSIIESMISGDVDHVIKQISG